MAQKRNISCGWGVAGLLVLTLIGSGIYSELTKETPVRVASVGKKSIQAYVEERGRTTLPQVYHITMPMQGRILPITVKEGDRVKVGDIVIRLDDRDWQDATRETEEILVAVDHWIESAKAEVRAMQALNDYSQWEWQADSDLLESNSIPEKQERASRRNSLDSQVRLEQSVAMLNMSKAIESITDLLPPYVGRNLDRTRVKSPVSGTVLKRYVWNEKVMSAGEPILEIGDLKELEITVDALTEDAVDIEAGDPVVIFGEALGELELNGSVRLVEPEAFTKISSLGVEEQRVAIKVGFNDDALNTLTERGKQLGLQYRVRVRIVTDEKESVLVVPRTALFHGLDGQWQLFKISNGKAKLTDVEVGILNDFEAEIISGVNEGDRVIAAPESSINDGVRVAGAE